MGEAHPLQLHIRRAGGGAGNRHLRHGPRQRQAIRADLLQGGKGGLARGTVMPDSGQIAHGLEEGRRENENEEAATKGEVRAPAPEIQRPQQVEAHIDGHHRHPQRREQLQHGGGQESDAQHRHGAVLQGFGAGAQAERCDVHAPRARMVARPRSRSSRKPFMLPISFSCASLAACARQPTRAMKKE